MGRGRLQSQLIVMTTLCFAALCGLAPLHVSARDSDAVRRANERAQEIAKQQQERERERQEREQAKQEQAKQEQAKQEQARQEQAKQEQARQEQARQAQSKQDQSKQDQSKPDQSKQDQADEKSQQNQDRQGSNSPNSNTNNSKDDQSSASSDQGKSATGSDAKSSAATDKTRVDKARAKVDVVDDDKVPSTVAEWLQGIFKSVPSATAAAPVVTPAIKTAAPLANAPLASDAKGGASKPILTTGSAPTAASAGATKGQKPAAGRPVGRDGLPAFPPQTPEVLASNLTPKNIQRAVALGFQLNGTSRVSRVDLNLTRLIAPAGMSADQARQLLQQEMPSEVFGVNQTYRIYRTATGAVPASQSETVRTAAPMATSCGTDRCFGASIIHWQPSLQACSRGVKIGVIDTGYDASHPTFTTKIIESRRSASSDREKSPDWHGTGVLALLAGDGNSGTPGLIPDAKFYVADIFYAGTDGLPSSDTASLLNALDWLEKRNVSVINMSLSGPPDDLLKAAIEGLSSKKIIFVAAAGNDGPTAPPSYPAAYSSVIAVTAVSRDMKSYRHASRGDHIDVAAPGVDIWTALPGGRGTYHSGTSFAVPYVTAVLATAYKGLAVKNKAEFLRRASVLDLGEPGRDPIYGRGLLLAPASCGPERSVVAAIPATSVKAQLDAPLGLTMQARLPR